MRVTALLLAIVLLVSMPLSVSAEPRVLSVRPTVMARLVLTKLA
jgi:hypothetical protein